MLRSSISASVRADRPGALRIESFSLSETMRPGGPCAVKPFLWFPIAVAKSPPHHQTPQGAGRGEASHPARFRPIDGPSGRYPLLRITPTAWKWTQGTRTRREITSEQRGVVRRRGLGGGYATNSHRGRHHAKRWVVEVLPKRSVDLVCSPGISRPDDVGSQRKSASPMQGDDPNRIRPENLARDVTAGNQSPEVAALTPSNSTPGQRMNSKVVAFLSGFQCLRVPRQLCQ